MESIKSKKLKEIIIKSIELNISIIKFQRENDTDYNHRKLYDKLIRRSLRSITTIENVKHIEILASIYNTFITGKEQYYVIMEESIYKNVRKWDMSEKGFQEFLKLDNEARSKFESEIKEREKQQELIKKAKEEGKKIDMVYKDGKIVPVIVDEPKN